MACSLRIISLVIGWLADMIFGDPEKMPHPVVIMGKIISTGEKLLNKGQHKVLKGTIMALSLIAITFFVCIVIIQFLSRWEWALFFFESIMVFYCLAGKTLITEVRNAFLAACRSVEEGRLQISRIVGRDTSNLTVEEIKTASLETLSENLSDGVVAPLFWYMLLGIPGMVTYKMINTMDSMIAYKSERYLKFGKCAAKIDDIANYLPARLTAFFMIIVSGKLGLFGYVKKFGRAHASPNSGYPEAALAGILGCRFGGTHNYFGHAVYKPFIGTVERPLTNDDLVKSLSINRKVETVMMILTIIVSWFRISLCSYVF
ncbi:MAG: cobalamin biosynthesis protein CobD [Paramuribaculum sp.]|nr:cobalamin biosynthesis protein CobD [Paramuribaculum sp.]